ncbi:MAG: LON peptidase substrate-binding domain-containing protein [Hyphomonadaceae bacterium]
MAESRTFPVLPLRDIVVYPKMAAAFCGPRKSVRALDEVMRKDKQILLAAQMDASEDEPLTDRIFTVGTVATVVQLLLTVRCALVEGAYRAKSPTSTRTTLLRS